MLASYVTTQILALCGKAALNGAPSTLVHSCYIDMLEVAAVTAVAIWRSYQQLWEGIDVGKRSSAVVEGRTMLLARQSARKDRRRNHMEGPMEEQKSDDGVD